MSETCGITEFELAERAIARRVTPDDVQNSILSAYYFTAAQGVEAATALKTFNGKSANLQYLTFCVLIMQNGFTVVGKSACASPENYQKDIGERVAKQDAVSQIWALLGYELKTKLDQVSI